MRTEETVIWRGNSIPPDVQRALRGALVNAAFPDEYATEALGEKWEAFKRAYVALQAADPRVVAPPGTTFPNAITRRAKARALDLLTIFLAAPASSREALCASLQVNVNEVIEDALLKELLGVSPMPAVADPPKRRRKKG